MSIHLELERRIAPFQAGRGLRGLPVRLRSQRGHRGCRSRPRGPHQNNTRYFKAALNAAGFNTGSSETPITPIMVGEAPLAHAFSKALFEEGLLATGIGYPTVPQGKARIRTIVTATHTRTQLDRAIEILVRVGRRMNILE